MISLIKTVENPEGRPKRIQIVLRAFQQARNAMEEAEAPLRKWIIRHLRDPMLPGTNVPRRSRRIGRAISLSAEANLHPGDR
jgi:hypothetical protein